MMTVVTMALTMSLIMQTNSNNPMKTAMMVLASSTILFFSSYWSLNSPVFMMIFYMLFMGGIILMMMVLASLMPNVKSLKKAIAMPTILILCGLTPSVVHMDFSYPSTTKIPFSSLTTVLFMLMLILVYFISFTSLLSTQQKAMRMYICRN